MIDQFVLRDLLPPGSGRLLLRQDGDRVYIDVEGFPPKASAHGIAGPMAAEFCRLALHKADLEQALGWIDKVAGLDFEEQEPIVTSALLSYCCVFDANGGGIRRKPLVAEDMFGSQQLARHRVVRKTRNKFVAHDDQLFPAHQAVVILDAEGYCLDVQSLTMKPFAAELLAELDIRELAYTASNWVQDRLSEITSVIIEDHNAVSTEIRRELKSRPPFYLDVIESDALSVLPNQE